MVLRPRNGLSLCAGGGGLDMGLMLAEPGFHIHWQQDMRGALSDLPTASGPWIRLPPAQRTEPEQMGLW